MSTRRIFIAAIITFLIAGGLYGLYRRGVFSPRQTITETHSLSGTVVSFTGDRLQVRHNFANKFPGVTNIQTVIISSNTPTTIVDKNGDVIIRTTVSSSDIKVGNSVVIYARNPLPSPLEVDVQKVDILRF